MVAMAVLTFTGISAHAALTLENAVVTDVTPSGFSVVCQASEPAIPGITVFSDAAGSNDISSDFEISTFPMLGGDPDALGAYEADLSMDVIRDQARNSGMLKIAVEGCLPGATYFFRLTAQGDTDSVSWPETAPVSVTTALETDFVADVKQLLVTLVNNADDLDVEGWLVKVDGEGTLAPVSAYVSDGAGINQATLNLSNLFDLDGKSWQPEGSQTITIEIMQSEMNLMPQTFSLDYSNTFVVSGVYPLTFNTDSAYDIDGDGLSDSIEDEACTDPMDADSDDDGIADGVEDANQNGQQDAGETNPCDADSDGDGIPDGVELGIITPIPDQDGVGPLLGTDESIFQPDMDSLTITDPLDRDSDNDGAWDGAEDVNRNGRVDAGESDPGNANSLPVAVSHIKKGYNMVAIPSDVSTQSSLNDWLSRFGSNQQIDKVVAYDSSTGHLVTLIPGASNPSVTLQNGQGLIVYANAEYQAGYTNVHCSSPILVSGYNLVGFSCSTDVDSAYDLLTSLGSSAVISIQRYSAVTGTIETAGFDGMTPVGIDFPLVPGEGYVVNMR